MKSRLLLFGCMLAAVTSLAQVPEDALRYSWMSPNGTARSQAVGGAMGSLGGDISAAFMNPAGLGLYKTGEVVLSPGLNFLNNKADFRGSASSDKSNSFNLGTSGVVIGGRKGAFSFAINRTANFNSRTYYKGQNDYSSYSEQYATELSNSKLQIGDPALNDPGISLGTKMAIYTYLIDTATTPSGLQVIGLPIYKLNSRQQENSIITKGGITELAFGGAANIKDKFFIGGSLGIPIVNYEKNGTYTERDISGNTDNDFDYSTLAERYTTKGIGVNAKVGIIYKPMEAFRVGLAIHTPTLYGLKDTYHADMTTATEKYANVQKVSSEVFNNNQLSQYEYDLVSPWKVLLSGSYLFGGGAQDVSKQKGFISADVEYINYKAASFRTANPNNSDNSYYEGVNKLVNQDYKGAFNYRVGGELKFNTIMVRAGFAAYGNPNKDTELKATRKYISGGLGYRNKGYFLDLTYVYGLQNDVNFPYILQDKANTFATIKGTSGNIVITGGFKF
jgi:hypothetical protein